MAYNVVITDARIEMDFPSLIGGSVDDALENSKLEPYPFGLGMTEAGAVEDAMEHLVENAADASDVPHRALLVTLESDDSETVTCVTLRRVTLSAQQVFTLQWETDGSGFNGTVVQEY